MEGILKSIVDILLPPLAAWLKGQAELKTNNAKFLTELPALKGQIDSVTSTMAVFKEDVADRLGLQAAKIDEIGVAILGFQNDKARTVKVNRIVERIMRTGRTQLATADDLDINMKSMIIAGCEAAGSIVRDLAASDIKDLDLSYFMVILKSHFKKIRNDYMINVSKTLEYSSLTDDEIKAVKMMTAELSDMIKEDIVLPAIRILLNDMAEISTGKYNGSTLDRIETTVMTFVNTIITQSINAHEKLYRRAARRKTRVD